MSSYRRISLLPIIVAVPKKPAYTSMRVLMISTETAVVSFLRMLFPLRIGKRKRIYLRNELREKLLRTGYLALALRRAGEAFDRTPENAHLTDDDRLVLYLAELRLILRAEIQLEGTLEYPVAGVVRQTEERVEAALPRRSASSRSWYGSRRGAYGGFRALPQQVYRASSVSHPADAPQGTPPSPERHPSGRACRPAQARRSVSF